MLWPLHREPEESAFRRHDVQDCLGLSGFKFCFSRAVPRKKKAIAVVERTKEDSISCVLMRGQLSLVPSGALPWCSTSLQSGRSLPVEL